MSNPFPPLAPQRIDSPVYRMDGVCDHALANLLTLFGGSRLLPIALGTADQDVQGQPAPIIGEAASGEHIHKLCRASIAVALGLGGLAAICFARREHLLEFLRDNPALSRTLITARSSQFTVWILADVAHRFPLDSQTLSVRMRGNVLAYDRAATAKAAYFLKVASPIHVDLETLSLPRLCGHGNPRVS